MIKVAQHLNTSSVATYVNVDADSFEVTTPHGYLVLTKGGRQVAIFQHWIHASNDAAATALPAKPVNA